MQVIRLLFVVTNITQGKSSYWDISHAETANPSLDFLVQLIIGVVPLLLMAYLISTKGYTPGKALFKLRVLKENGSKLSILAAVGRELGKVISIIPLGLGFWWIFFDKKRQAWHDKFVNSVVVKA